MASITIRKLEESVKKRLGMRAASHSRSMEEEARVILREVLGKTADDRGLGTRIHKRFWSVGGVDLETPDRHEMPRQPELKG